MTYFVIYLLERPIPLITPIVPSSNNEKYDKILKKLT